MFEKNYGKLAVAGIDKGVGATHFSILLGNYYSEILGKKTAIVDLNMDNDYEFLKQICIPESRQCKNTFNVQRVTYYTEMTRDSFAGIFCDKFECVILDVGNNYRKFYNEINMCDMKFLIGGLDLWKLPVALNGFKNEMFNGQWKFLYGLGSTKSAEYISGCIRKKIYHIPTIPDPFKINGKQLTEVERIIWEE